MSEPWERYQKLLQQQNRVISRSDFLDSDSSSTTDSSSTVDNPQPSTSGTRESRASNDDPQPSTSGLRQSTHLTNRVEESEEDSDSDISFISSSYGSHEPAIQHFHDVTRNLSQDFLPVNSLTMPSKKRRGSTTSSTSEEPIQKKKRMSEQVMGINVHVMRAHHRQEKKFGFLVSKL